MVVPLAAKVSENDDYRRAVVSRGIPFQGTDAFGMLLTRLEERGYELEWADVIQDLDRLQLVEVEQDGKRFLLRSEAQGTCGKVFQTVGAALPPTVQQIAPTAPSVDDAPGATPLY
jgi:hypothetical protein